MRSIRGPFRYALSIAFGTVALAVGGSAGAAVQAPPLVIGSIAVSDGTAVVAGAVADANASVQINGRPVTVTPSGDFLAAVDVGAYPDLVVALQGAHGESIVTRIPVDVAMRTNGAGILDHLLNAGIGLDVPADGFVVVDGQMPRIEGRVRNGSELAALEVNGVDALGKVAPNGQFCVVLTGASARQKDVTVVARDENGVSQTSTFSTTGVTSVIRTTAGTSVSAVGARGLKIADVQLDTDALTASRWLGVIVTIKDRRGYLVRGATVRLRATPVSIVGNGSTRAGFTNRIGKARFAYRLSRAALTGPNARTLEVATAASTPTARANLLVTLRLPVASGTG